MKRDVFRSTTSRRSLLRAAGLGGGGLLAMTAVGHGALSRTSSVAAVAPAAQDRVTVTFWTPGGSEIFCQGFETIAQNFEAIHPNIDIAETQCGTGEQAFNEVLLARIAAGNPPDATILWTSPIALAVRGGLEPLDSLMADSQYSQVENWPPAVLASCQWDGQTYGLPATAGSYAIIYNEEMFEAKGIPTDRASFPKTWDELRRLSKEFTRWDGDRLETAGFLPPQEPVPLYIWSALNGSQLFDAENRRYTIDAEPNVELMEYFVAWLDEEYQGDIQAVKNSGSWTYFIDEGQTPAFQEGRLAMVESGFWIAGDLYQVEPVFEGWNAAQYPVGPSGSSTASGYWPNWLAIPTGSEHVEEAFAYLDYMGVEGIKVWFNNIPDLPANEEVPRLLPAVTVERRGEEFAEEITDFFRAQLDIATPMWNSPIQDFANDQLLRALERIIAKQAQPRDALAEAQRACQSELDNVLRSAS